MPNRYGSKGYDNWKKDLETLEGMFGQKKLAEKIGVAPSTLRRWKTGKAKPKPDMAKKVNNIYRANKKKLGDEAVKRKIEKYVEDSKRRKDVRGGGFKVEAMYAWIQRKVRKFPQFTKELKHILHSPHATEYVVYPTGNDSRVQFVTPEQVIEGKFGKPPRTMKALLCGMYQPTTASAIIRAGGEDTLVHMDSHTPITAGVGKAWDLETTLSFLEAEFFSLTNSSFEPKMFLGYSL